jgi:hypothetical protein
MIRRLLVTLPAAVLLAGVALAQVPPPAVKTEGPAPAAPAAGCLR